MRVALNRLHTFADAAAEQNFCNFLGWWRKLLVFTAQGLNGRPVGGLLKRRRLAFRAATPRQFIRQPFTRGAKVALFAWKKRQKTCDTGKFDIFISWPACSQMNKIRA